MKAEKPDIQFSQHTYGPLAVNYALFIKMLMKAKYTNTH